jgi:response regulator RpfG family c-di-GMP phosphodiesterase
MQDHTVIGERILRAISGLVGVTRIVRHEHERWDGSGYPDGWSARTSRSARGSILAADA